MKKVQAVVSWLLTWALVIAIGLVVVMAVGFALAALWWFFLLGWKVIQ